MTRLNRATAREAAREAQQYFKDAGDGAGQDFGDGLSKGLTSKVPEVEKALKKVTDASGKVIVEQEKLNALRDKGNATDVQMITQSEKLRKAHADEAAAISVVNRALDEHSNKTRRFGDDVSNAAAKVGDLGGALRGLGAVGALGSLPAVATAITSVAGALQQLSGAALAGPGIFAGIAASAGTAALGMKGMSDAFTASIKALDGTKTSVEAANKALAALSPNAADAVKGVVGLKGTFDDLRGIASQNMFEGFSGNLRSLVSADLPVLTRGIDGISKGLGQNLTQLLSSLGSSSSQGFLDRILGNTGNAQGKLTAAIDPIVHAVGVLTAAGSDTLPRLATAVGAVADRFNQFITTADANGNLAKWIDQGLNGFTQLGNTVLNIGKIFTDLTAAAGGGQGLLGTLESATGKLHEFLSSTQGQADLRQYFAEGRDMLSQLKDIAVAAGPVLAGMFNAASSVTRAWLPVIKQILDIINSIPGGAEAVVGAFVGWQSIKGIAAVASGLSGIVNILKFAIPGAAAEGAAGITAAFAGISLPGWLSSFLAAGGSIAALPGVAVGFATVGSDMLHDAPNSAENARARGTAGLAGGAPGVRPTDPRDGLSGGGGPFGGTPGYGASVDPNWSPTLGTGPAPRPGTFRRRDGSIGTLPLAPGAPGSPATPGVSSYSDPVVTSGGGGGAGSDPFIDPSKWAGGDPLANMPAPVAGADPQKVFEADSRLITASNDLAQKKLALQVLEAKGNASQQELLTAKNNVAEQERTLYDAQAKDLEARRGQMAKASSDLQSIFAPLDQDFGISGGIPGIVKNLVTFLGNTALAGAIASSPQLQSAAMTILSTPKNGAASPGYGSALGFPTSAGSPFVAGPRVGGDYGLPAGTNSGGYGGGGTQFPAWVNQMAADFGIKPSTYPGHQESDRHEAGYAPNPGHENRGIDWSGPVDAMQKFADYLSTIPGALEQVIWKNPNTGQTDTIAGGQPVSGYYDAGTLAEHENHVHTRQSSPIPLPGGSPMDMGPSTIGPAPLGGGNGAPTPMGWGGPGLPAGITGGGGQGPILGANPAGPGLGGAGGVGAGGPGFSTGIAPQGGGGPGFQVGGAGFDGAMMAAGALDLMAPGAGQAAQVGLKLGKRAIEYGGQVAGIAASGVAETFLPSGSALGNFGNSWFGKIAGGVAGARPAKDNLAGKAGATPPQQGQPGQGDPAGQPGQPGVTVNYTNNQATEDRAGADLTNHLSTMNSTPGPGNPRG